MRSALIGLVGAVIFGFGGWLPAPPSALPVAPSLTSTAVDGIPDPCIAKHPWPASATPVATRRAMEKAFGLQLSGSGWTNPGSRPLVKIVWETLDALNCTTYLDDLRRNAKQPVIKIHAGPTRSWAWGDWGLTNPGKLTFDFAKWQSAYPADKGRLVRIVVHELGHMHQMGASRDQASFRGLYQRNGGFSKYGSYSMSETMSEVIGYYVARCALENPYDQAGPQERAYYQWARETIFNGVEFGPAVGQKPSC
ncbi:hypothetical protein ACSDQ9_03795 [Aestuariimicrobium soli]|uniref:hypothetical protein n=1 Tax=Aestuariimicrobium soli TaxID=2035834 RepID=UPI003EBAE39E